jgi:Bacterial transcriptional regulator
LQHRGFAEQDAKQRYRLSSRPVLLVERFHREENLPTLFRPALLAVCQEVQELVHLGIMEGPNVLYLDKVEPDRTIRVWSRVGRQVSVITTALGRAMVAAEGTPDTLLSVYTANANAEIADRFSCAVADARVHGFATEREENEAGICCVGVGAAAARRTSSGGEHHRAEQPYGRRAARRTRPPPARRPAGCGAAGVHGSARCRFAGSLDGVACLALTHRHVIYEMRVDIDQSRW